MHDHQSTDETFIVLDGLYTRSAAQADALRGHVLEVGIKSVAGSADDVARDRPFWGDKRVALDPDKAEFCYRLCRAPEARRVVEAGTSYGLSTR
ncbi:MAG: hypothetical protein KGI68_04115 [Alphaproteobacteria bacterium]|nr:hypothetical protein [Alphaproteobacteria bacterium]